MTHQPPSGSDPRLVGIANQADHSNRPTVFIAIGLVVVLAAVIYLITGITRFQSGLSNLKNARASANSSLFIAQQIRDAESSTRNPRDYGTASLMPDHIRNVAAETWGVSIGPELNNIITIPTSPQRRPLVATNNTLNFADVTVSTRASQPLASILTFIEAALTYSPLDSTFVAELNLTPVDTGWNASITFRQYEAAQRN